MCGIAGVMCDEPGVYSDLPRRMIAAQSHRGPDATGVATPDSHLAVGHARLSIVDLTPAGNQPFVTADSVLVYNGEIYNHLEIRAELEKLGAKFNGTSDTATLLVALQTWGVEKTLPRIRGMFAFAFYLRRERTLYLCRDRLGIKPLHYLRRAGKLYFSSEVKGLQAVTATPVDPIRALFSMASVADDSLDRTAFHGVKQVAPGTALRCVIGSNPTVHRYYSPIDDLDEALYRELERTPESRIVEMFASEIERSVQSMLMSDVRVGAFVSGGIDSSVIAILARRSASDFPLFSSNVVGPESEIEAARLLARAIDAPLHESAFEPADFLANWARATWHYECPIVRHMNAVPFSVVAGVARSNGVKVVLTGEGADELFFGYPKLLTRRFDGLAKSPVDTLLSLYGRVPGLRQHLWPTPSDQPDDFINLLTQDYQRQRIREAAMPKLAFLGEEAAREHYLTLQMLQESLHSLLHRNDRMGMSHSIEARFPFLDERIIRFGINLPTKFKIHWSKRLHNYKHPFLEDKWVVRSMAKNLLPRSLVKRRKNGFPLAGYRSVQLKSTFFRNGYVMEALGLTDATIEYVLANVKPMFVGRLGAVELFGRMYEQGWTVDRATSHVREHAALLN